MSGPDAYTLASEILQALEADSNPPLTPLARKAARLARIRGEEEYRLLFELHIDGIEKGRKSPRVQKWPTGQKPEWDPVEAFNDDRRIGAEAIQGMPLERLEYFLQEVRHELRSEKLSSKGMDNDLKLENDLGHVLGRIRNRIWLFANTIHSILAGAPSTSHASATTKPAPTGSKILIGHGKSKAWLDLRDLLQNRLHLAWDEFNREPVAGLTTVERLQQMLDDAILAFVVMTAEDQHPDGTMHARENVIHEAGLFQGRLGFKRAIVLLEDGCIEFSNIVGLTQIRFPKSNIMAASEEIRRVLEREGIIASRKGRL